jgi:hypothetical protein
MMRDSSNERCRSCKRSQDRCVRAADLQLLVQRVEHRVSFLHLPRLREGVTSMHNTTQRVQPLFAHVSHEVTRHMRTSFCIWHRMMKS